MLSWFAGIDPYLIALFAVLLWSVVNVIDEQLIERYAKHQWGPDALFLFSAFFSALVLPLLGVFLGRTVWSPGITGGIMLVGIGMLNALWILWYLRALYEAEASLVAPFFQTIPLFAFIFAWLFLRELPTQMQLFAGLIIMAGGAILSVEVTEGKVRVRSRFLILMLGVCITVALTHVLIKFFIMEEGSFWLIMFWNHVGMFLFGALYAFVRPKAWRALLSLVRDNGKSIFSLNLTNETLTTIADLLFMYATLGAAVAFIETSHAWQPLFVLILSIAIAWYAPRFSKERLESHYLIQKISGMVCMIIGGILLAF